MPLSPRRLVFWLILFATAGFCWILSGAHRSPMPRDVTSPWIPLPMGGMDASQEPLRTLVDNSLEGNAFAARCTVRDGHHPDRYRLRISRDGWRDFRDIEFTALGRRLEVHVCENPLLHAPVAAPVVVMLDRAAAEPIRRAWATQALWHAEQPEDASDCTDHAPVTLEACIDGRYAIRQHACDDAYSETRALWRAVTTVLPPPRPAPSLDE